MADKQSDGRSLWARIRDLLFDFSNDVGALEQNASVAKDELAKASDEIAALQTSLENALAEASALRAENDKLREQNARLSVSNTSKAQKREKKGH